MDAEPIESADQQQWREIAAALRAQLAKQIGGMAGMAPGDALSLANAVDMAMWCEVKAATFDDAVAERKATLEREQAWGG